MSIVGLLWVGAASTGLHGQNGDSAQLDAALARRAEDRLRTLHEEADRLAVQQKGVLGQLRQLEVARQIAAEELRQADAAATEAETEAQALEAQVERLEGERDAVRPMIESRLVEMYKLGRGRYARLLLSASDLRRFAQATRTVAAMAARDQERFRRYERQLTELDASIEALTARDEVLAARRAKAARARAAAEQAIVAQDALVREIDQRRDLNAQLTGELQDAQHKLEGTLREAAQSTGTAILPIGPFRGALPWPTNGQAQHRSEGMSSAAIAQRPGLEIVAAQGTPVHAIYDGRVAYAGSFDGLGNLVIVDHGGQTFTLYGHLTEFEVAQGTVVIQGQPLGRVGTSPMGRSTLYFELRVNGRPVDPLQWLSRSH